MLVVCHFRDDLSLMRHFTCMRVKTMQVLFAVKCLQKVSRVL